MHDVTKGTQLALRSRFRLVSALDGQLLLAGTALESSNSNVLILHPCLSTWSQPLVTNIHWPPPPSPIPLDYSPADGNTKLAYIICQIDLSE